MQGRALPTEDSAEFRYVFSSLGRSGFSDFFFSDAGLVSGTLGIDVAVNEFDDRHRCHVAVAEAGAQNPRVTALTVLVAWAKNVKQFDHVGVLFQLAGSLATGV